MTTIVQATDAQLWARAADGDQAAFAVLFDRHAKAVYNHCFRATASRSLAEDATQSTFLIAWRKRDQVRVIDGSVLPWLLSVATNAARTERRSAGRWLAALLRMPPDRDAAVEVADLVADRVDDMRRMSTVLRAVALLPRAQREALMLCVWSSVSYAAAATLLGISESSVRARVSKARRRLNRLLNEGAAPAVPHRRVTRRLPARVATAGLVMAVGAAIAWAGIGGLHGSGQRPEVYALGDGVLSPPIRDAGRECLKDARFDGGHPRPVLLNDIEQPGRGAIVVYRAQSKLIYCTVGPAIKDGPEPRDFYPGGESIGVGVLDSSRWLPGPISLEDAWSSDEDSGYVDVAGRVSEQVARVVLDDGAGHQSTARLAKGTFVVLSDGRVASGAGVLISYDSNGREIDRRPALTQPAGRCYTDPAGNLVNPTSDYEFELAYKSNKAQCKPAARW